MAGGDAFNIGRVVQRTFGLISRNWATFLTLAAVFSGLPYLSLMQVLPAVLSIPASADSSGTAISIGLGAVYLLGAMVLQAALARASVDELAGNRVSLVAALRAGVAALLPMVGLLLFGVFLFVVGVFSLAIASGIATLGAGYLLILVFSVIFVAVLIYLFVRWTAVVPVLVVERSGVIQSLRRSSALTEGHRWAIFGLIVLCAVAFALLEALVRVAAPLMMEVGPAWIVAGSIDLLLHIATSMIVAVGIAAIYFELRQIKEGVGVEELAQVFA